MMTSRSTNAPASISLKLKRIKEIVNEVNLIKSIKFERLVKQAYQIGQTKTSRSLKSPREDDRLRNLEKSKEHKNMKRLFHQYKESIVSGRGEKSGKKLGLMARDKSSNMMGNSRSRSSLSRVLRT